MTLPDDATSLDEAYRWIKDAGYRPDEYRSYVTPEGRIYAFSVESDKHCFNHPMYEVQGFVSNKEESM